MATENMFERVGESASHDLAQTVTVRIIGYQPALGRMFSAWRTIERTRFG